MLITPDQIRAARALKNWSQTELAERTGLAVPTIANIEAGKQSPGKNTMEKIITAFIEVEIEFTENEGVQKKKPNILAFQGVDGFQSFIRDTDNTAFANKGSEFLVSNVNEADFVKWEGGNVLHSHTQAILESGVRYKIIIAEGDNYMPADPYAEYRWAPKEQFFSVPLYIYGNKVGIIGFEENDVNVFVIEHPFIAALCRRQFYELWERTIKIPIATNSKSKNKKAGK